MKKLSVNIGFCENGAGYGGAVISLEALLKNISSEFSPFIYTEKNTKEYQQLNRLGKWKPLPPNSFIDNEWLRRKNIPFRSEIDNIFNLIPYALRFYSTFKRDKIDVVYLNNDPSCNLAPALAARIAGIPIVLHARGFSANIKSSRWLLSSVKHCFAVSKAIKSQLEEIGLPSWKCTIVPEGLDLTMFSPQAPSAAVREELGFSESTRVITLVAGLIEWKGQNVLLDACPKIFEKFPSAQVLIVGSAYGKDKNFAETIQERVALPPYKGRVHLLGARKDIPDILSISDVVLHTSTKPEPFGRTFLEGMAMGKPVIASNEGGPPEVIDHGVDGLLIQPRDPLRLADAVNRIIADPLLAENLGKNAVIKAKNYSIEKHAHSIYGILRNILN